MDKTTPFTREKRETDALVKANSREKIRNVTEGGQLSVPSTGRQRGVAPSSVPLEGSGECYMQHGRPLNAARKHRPAVGGVVGVTGDGPVEGHLPDTNTNFSSLLIGGSQWSAVQQAVSSTSFLLI